MKRDIFIILIFFYSIVIQGQSMKGIFLGQNTPDILPQGILKSTIVNKDKTETNDFSQLYAEASYVQQFIDSKETTSLGGEPGIILFRVDENNKVNYLKFFPSSHQITYDFIDALRNNYGLVFDDMDLITKRAIVLQKGRAEFIIDQVSKTFTIMLLDVDPKTDF